MRDITQRPPLKLLRSEIRRRALRAAAAVAVGAITGCGSIDEPVAGAAHADASAPADGRRGADGAAGSDVGPTSRQPDGGSAGADAGPAPDVGAVADAGRAVDIAQVADASGADSVASVGDTGRTTGTVCKSTDDWQDYKQCCDENGWDWNKGCMAWGPPAPPHLNPSALAALISGLHAAPAPREVTA